VTVSLPSLEPTIENVATHLRQRHDTALVAAPGSGTTTSMTQLKEELQQQGVEIVWLDMKTTRLAEESLAALQALTRAAEPQPDCVAVIDHAASLPANQFAVAINTAAELKEKGTATCLWLGPLDACRTPAEQEGGLPPHLRCIDFLTFNELSDVLLSLLDDVFPGAPQDIEKNRLKDRWRENMARIQRLRNTVAHLRNVQFREMEGLAGIVETMRNDLRAYAQWR
jgi:hypothetical protein